MQVGVVSDLWRYPVSGLQGERIPVTEISGTGIAGDHLFAIQDGDTKRIFAPKSHPSS